MPWDGLFALDAPIDFLSMHAVHYYDYLALHAQLIANNVGKHACMHLEQPFFIFLLFFSFFLRGTRFPTIHNALLEPLDIV